MSGAMGITFRVAFAGAISLLCAATASAVPGAAPINLVSSWNMLGNSVNAPLTVSTAFGNAINVATVWKWIPSSAKWAFYTPSLADGGAAYALTKGYDFLTVINPGEGYWVNAKAPFVLQPATGTAITTASLQDVLNPPNPIAAGWSLISVGDNPTPSVFNNGIGLTPPATGAVSPNLTTLWAWDSGLVNWYFYAPSLDANGTLATYIAGKSYLNFGTKTLDPTMGFWVNRPASVAPVLTPINTAKNLFTSLRTSLVLLTNPARTGFFDTEITTAKTNFRSAVLPKLNTITGKLDLINSAIKMTENLQSGSIVAYPVCNPMMWGVSCQAPDPANAANVVVTDSIFNPKSWVTETCATTLPATFSSGPLPAGTVVSCNGMIDMPVMDVVNSNFSMFTFIVDVTPGTAANSYNYSSMTQTDVSSIMGIGLPVTTLSASHSGVATVVKKPSGSNSSIAVNGQLAANGVLHAYDQVALNQTRTYLSGVVPLGAPAGYAVAQYDVTGNINSMLAGGVPSDSLSVLAGSTFTQLEDVNGQVASMAAARNLGRAMTAVIKAKTVTTQIDGTLTANNYATDLSGTASLETHLTFNGSLTNLANSAVGQFFNGILTDIRDYTSFDNTLPKSNSNRIKEIANFSGTVTNNTVAPVAVYQLNASEDKTVANQRTMSFTYTDPSHNTVTVSAYNVDTTPGTALPYSINVSSGGVIGVLTKSPGAKTSGLTGNLYTSPVTPANLIGTLNGTTVYYSDGTFASLQ